MPVGERGTIIPIDRYTVTIRMTPALRIRWAALRVRVRAILMIH